MKATHPWSLGIAILLGVISHAEPSRLPGDGPSNGGDPLQYEVYDRAAYSAAKMEEKGLLTPDLLKTYREAVKELRVEPDESITKMGITQADPERPGLRAVFVKPSSFYEMMKIKDEWEVIRWVVHEVFQTKMNGARPYDADEDITRNLAFSAAEFKTWRLQRLSAPAAVSQSNIAGLDYIVPGSYLARTSRWENDPRVTLFEGFGEYAISNPIVRRGEPTWNSSFGVAQIALKPKQHPKGWSWISSDAIVQYHYDNGCQFDYALELVTTYDSFFLREKYPTSSYKYESGDCRLGNYGWHHHADVYVLSNYGDAYRYAADRETDPTKKAELLLFLAAWENDVASIESALQSGISANARDWHGRNPVMLALFRGNETAALKLLPSSDLRIQCNEFGTHRYTNALNALLAGRFSVEKKQELGAKIAEMHSGEVAKSYSRHLLQWGLHNMAEPAWMLQVQAKAGLSVDDRVAFISEVLLYTKFAFEAAYGETDEVSLERIRRRVAFAEKSFLELGDPTLGETKWLVAIVSCKFNKDAQWKLVEQLRKLKYEVVERMVDAGFSINGFDSEGDTVWTATAGKVGEDGQKAAKEFLVSMIEKHPEIDHNYKNKKGESVLYLVTMANDRALFDALISKVDLKQQPMLMHAAARALFHSETSLLKPALEAGAPLNGQNIDGETPLDVVLLVVRRYSGSPRFGEKCSDAVKVRMGAYRWLKSKGGKHESKKIDPPSDFLMNCGISY